MKKIILPAVFSALVLLTGCGKDAAGQTAAKNKDETAGTESAYSKIYITEPAIIATAKRKVSMTDEQFEKILDNTIFVGDSVTSGFAGYQKVSMNNVAAKTGVGPSNIRENTFEYNGGEYEALTILSYAQPENVVIFMGLNDINTYSPENFSELYMDFVKDAMAVCKNAQFYIFSVTPVTAGCENISNDTIDAVNAQLEKTISESGENIRYVDCNSALKGPEGCMNEDYSGGDGIHFNSGAYDIMLEQYKYSICGSTDTVISAE